jgi:DNA-directed RNA polymerase I subunit RPA12
MATQAKFTTDVAFCPACGALLPPMPNMGDSVTCSACKHASAIDSFAQNETSYTVVFNKRENATKRQNHDEEEDEGPTIERKCPKCGHEKMGYAALQLRSADEGQTVFFTCLKCKYKESENS